MRFNFCEYLVDPIMIFKAALCLYFLCDAFIWMRKMMMYDKMMFLRHSFTQSMFVFSQHVIISYSKKYCRVSSPFCIAISQTVQYRTVFPWPVDQGIHCLRRSLWRNSTEGNYHTSTEGNYHSYSRSIKLKARFDTNRKY